MKETDLTLISILMPARNEGGHIFENIETVIAKFEKFNTTFQEKKLAFEIIITDDGSSDDTAENVLKAAKKYDNVKLCRLNVNRGKGLALSAGFKLAQGSLIFFLDADLEIDADFCLDLLKKMQETNADIVVGSKMLQKEHEHYPLFRKIISWGYSTFRKTLLPLPINDTQTGIKLFRREVLERIFDVILVRKYAYDIELLAIANGYGYTIVECPIKVNFQENKKSSASINNIYCMFIDTLAVFYRLKILKYYAAAIPKAKNYQPKFSIIVPVKNDNAYLRQCVENCLNLDYTNFEIIVLPDTPITNYDPRVKIIATGAELPAVKRNLGVEASTGEIIAFIDDDAYPANNWLTELAGSFSDDSIAAVGGPGVTPIEDSYWQQISGAVFSSLAASGSYRYRYIIDRRREVQDYPTCNLSVRKAVYQQIGGFKCNYWPGEDTELCHEIVALGKKIIYEPQVEVYHHRRHFWNGHFKQVGQYALHRGYFVKKFPKTSCLPQYFVPTLFMLGSALGWLTYFIYPPLFYTYISVMSIYATFVFLATILATQKYILVTCFATLLNHYAYGWWFLVGLFSKSMRKEEEYRAKRK